MTKAQRQALLESIEGIIFSAQYTKVGKRAAVRRYIAETMTGAIEMLLLFEAKSKKKTK